MEILYLPLSATAKNRVKAFLDVVLQRLGDGAAGLIVLFYALFMMQSEPASLAYFSLALITNWTVFIFLLRSGYVEALRAGLEAQAITWEGRGIDYADKQTIEAVLQNLKKEDERGFAIRAGSGRKLGAQSHRSASSSQPLAAPFASSPKSSVETFRSEHEPRKIEGNSAIARGRKW